MAVICEHYGAALIVDEAHAIGVVGPEGAGLLSQLACQSSVFASIYTFGKAMGMHGAIVVGSNLLRDYLINYCRQFIYTTAPSPRYIGELSHAYQRMRSADDRRAKLKDNISYFNQRIAGQVLTSCEWVAGNSPIQALLVGDTQRAKNIETVLRQNGFAVKAIVSPTVPAGTERIRICLHSHNSHDEIDRLVSCVASSI